MDDGISQNQANCNGLNDFIDMIYWAHLYVKCKIQKHCYICYPNFNCQHIYLALSEFASWQKTNLAKDYCVDFSCHFSQQLPGTRRLVCSVWKQDMTTAEIWWRHEIDTFSVLLVLREKNPPVTDGLPHKVHVIRCFDFLFVISLKKVSTKKWNPVCVRPPWRSNDVTEMVCLSDIPSLLTVL